jgi:hypothetical protein
MDFFRARCKQTKRCVTWRSVAPISSLDAEANRCSDKKLQMRVTTHVNVSEQSLCLAKRTGRSYCCQNSSTGAPERQAHSSAPRRHNLVQLHYCLCKDERISNELGKSCVCSTAFGFAYWSSFSSPPHEGVSRHEYFAHTVQQFSRPLAECPGLLELRWIKAILVLG